MAAMHTMRKSQTGFSLVELMVAAVIGLIGCIIIFQVFAVFESQKRNTTGGGDAQSNLALAMHTLERDVRQAGYGLNDPTIFGCTVNGHDTSGTPTDFSVTSLAPALITHTGANNAATTPDTLRLIYGSSQLAHFPPKLTQTLTAATDTYRVDNRHGFQVNDILLVAGPIPGTPVCTLSQVATLPAAAPDLDAITHVAGRYNKSGGLGPNYAVGTTQIFNLGQTPTFNTYTVNNGQLLVQGFRDAAAVPIMDGIVQMQVRYGKDTNNDNILDVYDAVTPTTAAEWAQVLAIRLALVARVSLYERDVVPSSASVTLWSGGPTWTPTSDEQHYRYRVIDTVIPLRNMIWRKAS